MHARASTRARPSSRPSRETRCCRRRCSSPSPGTSARGGYRLGEFPPGWLEWNDRSRDTQRGFWLRQGREGATGLGDFAHRFTASSAQFAHDHRAPTASVNFITAHDGFTLRDLVSYDERHNLANGEGNRDGHAHNLSHNCGVEGPSDDPAVRAARTALQRALLAALLLSQGTPMLLAGDELGHTQQGNNNAYCQDNDITWLAWDGADAQSLSAYVARLLALRREAPALRHAQWWPSDSPRIRWLRPDGEPMASADWDAGTALAVLFADGEDDPHAWLVMVNAGAAPVPFTLPPGGWQRRLSSDPAHDTQAALRTVEEVPASAVWIARS